MHLLGIDVGGTGIKAAIVDTARGELVSERVRIPTPKPATPDAVAVVLKNLVQTLDWHGPAGVGFPAVLQRGTVMTAANIDKSFIGFPLVERFTRSSGCTIHAVNDADAAGMAEMRFGAGRNQKGVVLIITIGTGLGTAVFVDGKLLPNTELGHIHLDNGQEAEPYASEAARVNQKLKWKEWGQRFNHYLSTMENLLWPDLIILGGGVSKKLEKFAPLLTTRAPVVAAGFLNQAGIVGAALYAESALVTS